MMARNLLMSRDWPYTPDSAVLYTIPAAGKRVLKLSPLCGQEESHWDAGIAAGQQRVWCAAIVLTDELIDRYQGVLRAGARVVELGSGLGLPGMVCAAMGAQVLLTDVPQAVPCLENGIAVNCQKGLGGSGSVRAVPLEWDAIAAEIFALQEGRFDFVLCSDCVYEACYGENWRELAETIEQLCDENTVALVSMQRRDDPGLDRFVMRLRRSFEVEQLCTRKGLSGPVEVYSARRLTEKTAEAAEARVCAEAGDATRAAQATRTRDYV